jgi:hypothetical protein
MAAVTKAHIKIVGSFFMVFTQKYIGSSRRLHVLEGLLTPGLADFPPGQDFDGNFGLYPRLKSARPFG